MPLIQELPSSPSNPTSEQQRTHKIQIKNRRKLYLDRHPSYFTSPDLELADPLLYDRCIRRFQSAAEREADGKAKGYSGVLEADLYRTEAKLAAIEKQQGERDQRSSSSPKLEKEEEETQLQTSSSSKSRAPKILHSTSIPSEPDDDEAPSSKEEGLEKWKYEMTLRFLRGGDEDFEYGDVDESEEWDVIESREVEEKWFEEEEPGWVGEGEGEVDDLKGKGTGGETGVQDF